MSASPSHSHPRRRPQKASSPLSTHGMSLRKGGTFSSPKSMGSDVCPLENLQYKPHRSTTCPESLEELLKEPSVRRIQTVLDNFDKTVAGHKHSATGSNILSDPEVLPVPGVFLNSSTLRDTHLLQKKTRQVSHEHASDSGLGTSINTKDGPSSAQQSMSTSVSTSHAAITRSFSALGGPEEKHTLSDHASETIRKYIVDPILAEQSLKDFHPLIADVPRRIGEKNICNLRDLEKTLIFLAPELSATAASYQRFCERSIQLLHATVDRLSDEDQRLPTDRPYSTNYFLDLVEQIRRYASIMAATHKKDKNGEDHDEMDYSRDEKITLRGGLSHNGRPVELVREKNGKVIPLAEGADFVATGFTSTKRTFPDDETDSDEVTRSMARRRKSDKAGDIMHICRDCKKEFKRPCDLTKHEKTHSRPWKCTEQGCKYFELGWPTEKERDRHFNDKHSNAPANFRCHYPPCTYASKRESNCKQHMEKTHGWTYVRAKTTRKKAQTTGSVRSPPTPLTPFMGTPHSTSLPTPVTPFAPSPMIDNFNYPYGLGTPVLNVNNYQSDFRRDSVTTDTSALTYSSGHSPPEQTSFEDAVTPEDIGVNHNDIYYGGTNCGISVNTNFPSVFQQHTPAMSTGFEFEPTQLPLTSGASFPHLSPGGQADMTLFSPQVPIDEGYGDMDYDMSFTAPVGDFELFPSGSSNMHVGNTSALFPDMTSNFGGQFDNMYVEPTTTLDDLIGLDHPQH